MPWMKKVAEVITLFSQDFCCVFFESSVLFVWCLRESGGQLEFNMIQLHLSRHFNKMLVPKHFVLFNPIMNQEETTWKHFKASNTYQNSVVKLAPPSHTAGIHIGSVKNNAGVCHFLMYCWFAFQLRLIVHLILYKSFSGHPFSGSNGGGQKGISATFPQKLPPHRISWVS